MAERYPRWQKKTIKQLMSERRVLLLSGPRQSGKPRWRVNWNPIRRNIEPLMTVHLEKLPRTTRRDSSSAAPTQ